MVAIPLLARHYPTSYRTYSSSDVPGGRKCNYSGQSVRAIPMRVITVGKKRSRGVQLIVDEYTEKLRHYCSIDDVLIRSNPKNARDVKAQIEDEDITVTNLIKPDDWDSILSGEHYWFGSKECAAFLAMEKPHQFSAVAGYDCLKDAVALWILSQKRPDELKTCVA